MPKRIVDGKWKECLTGAGNGACYCYESGQVGVYGTTNKAIPLPRMPSCSDGTETAEYIPAGGTCGGGFSAPCWKCSDGSYHAASCMAGSQSCVSDEANLPFMAAVGTGVTITIPSFIVSDYDGEVLRQGIRQEATYGPVYITMAWEVPQLEKVNYELWTSSEDHNGAEFKRDFQEVALDLIEKTNFRPRYFIYDGDAQGCTRPGVTCGDQCILNGKYCAPDPDGQLNEKLSGADVVKENLRQMCVGRF